MRGGLEGTISSGERPDDLKYFQKISDFCGRHKLVYTQELREEFWKNTDKIIDRLNHYKDLGLNIGGYNVGFFADIELDDSQVSKLLEFQNKGVCFYRKEEIFDCISCVDKEVTDDLVWRLISKWESTPNPFRGFMRRHRVDDDKFKKLDMFITCLLDTDYLPKDLGVRTVGYFYEKFSLIRDKMTDEEFEEIFRVDEEVLRRLIDFMGVVTLEDFRCIVKNGGIENNLDKLELFTKLIGVDFKNAEGKYKNLFEEIFRVDEEVLRHLIDFMGVVTLEDFRCIVKNGGIENNLNKLELFTKLIGVDFKNAEGKYKNFSELRGEITDEEFEEILRVDEKLLERFVRFSLEDGVNGKFGEQGGFFGVVTLEDVKYIIGEFGSNYNGFKNLCLFVKLIGCKYDNYSDFSEYFGYLKRAFTEDEFQKFSTMNVDFFEQIVDLFLEFSNIDFDNRRIMLKYISEVEGMLSDRIFDELKGELKKCGGDVYEFKVKIDSLYVEIGNYVMNNKSKIMGYTEDINNLEKDNSFVEDCNPDHDDYEIKVNGLRENIRILDQEIIDFKILGILRKLLIDKLLRKI